MKIVKLLVCALVLMSCKHQKINSGEYGHLEKISIQESACEGDCPVYSLVINSDGKAFYKGELNVNKIGRLTYQFSNKEMADLFQMISIIDFNELNNKYNSGIADLPDTVITYKEKQILIKDLRAVPKTLEELANKLQKLARSTGYIN